MIIKSALRMSSIKPPVVDPRINEAIKDYLDVEQFVPYLIQKDITFFAGVPDPIQKSFISYLVDHHPKNNIVCANEGLALSCAAGNYMATKKFPCIYLQNSGIGNLINPFLSLAHQNIYSIPMLMMIGWRGEPGFRDEPQYLVQGRITDTLLTSMGINFDVLPDYIEGAI